MLNKLIILFLLFEINFCFFNQYDFDNKDVFKTSIQFQNIINNLNNEIKFDEDNNDQLNQNIKFENDLSNKQTNIETFHDFENLYFICDLPNYRCKPILDCSINNFNNIDSIRNCTYENNKVGICCPLDNIIESDNLPPISYADQQIKYKKNIVFVNNQKVKKHTRFSNQESYKTKTQKIENELIKRNFLLTKNSAEMTHQNFFGYSKEAQRLGYQAEELIQLVLNTKTFAKTRNIVFEKQNESLINLNNWAYDHDNNCFSFSICPNTKYRTANGLCNNKINTDWGKAMTIFNRVLDPNYGDGFNSPKQSYLLTDLPNARKLSIAINYHLIPSQSQITLATMQFGQFLDHDFSLAALTRTESGTSISCCNDEIQKNPEFLKHPACFEIKISKNDPFYKKFNITCMNFVRSLAGKRNDCSLGPREQLNQLTSFIDGSMIYGSSKEEQKSLRKFKNGQLLSSLINNQIFLPIALNGTCNVPKNDFKQCFRAGEIRTNENIDLTVMQTIFLREHNRIAFELKYENPHWTDEKLFQETRLIIGAIIQHITYNEFLPAVLGRETMHKFNLFPRQEGHIDLYDPELNPSIFSGFATAAYRFHSMVQGYLHLKNDKEELIGKIPLASTFNNPTLLRKQGVYDGLINGMTSQPMQEQDNFFTTQLTNHLFKPFNSSFGLDLFAINLQRGRDHGIPSYNDWRKICGLDLVNNLNDLENFLEPKIANILNSFYKNIEDIDLFAAGVSEKKILNSQLGPTFACIVGEQFRRLKFGDRFYYENSNQLHSFSLEQLKEIKKVTMARLFCDNGNKIKYMQPYAFIRTNFWWNKKISCKNNDRIPSLNLRAWS